MNEIIKVDFDSQTVSARELHEQLKKCKTFQEFFVKVSELKVKYDFEELKELNKAVRGFSILYGADAITYLSDSIVAEMTISCKTKEAIKLKEKEIVAELVNNFNKAFPAYTFIKTEKQLNPVGRVDIFADFNGTPVIIEVKTGRKNPTLQLLAYGSLFKNPILIGITEEELDDTYKKDGIKYFTLSKLKEDVDEWII